MAEKWEEFWTPGEYGTLFKKDQLDKCTKLGGPSLEWSYWDLARQNALAYPNKEAVVDTFFGIEPEKRRRITWSQFFDNANTIILNLHDLGIRKGNLVLTQLNNCVELYYSLVVNSKLQAIYPYIQTGLGEQETKDVLEFLEPDVTITHPTLHGSESAKWHLEYREGHAKLKHVFVVTKPGEPLPEGTRSFSDLLDTKVKAKYGNALWDQLKTDPLFPYEIIPTGGTTGIPKMCFHSAQTWPQCHGQPIISRCEFGPYDKLLVFGPINGGTGTTFGRLAGLLGKACEFYLTDYSDEDACRITQEERITKWVANPALMIRASTSEFFDKYDMSSLRAVCYAGAPMPKEVASTFWDKGIKTCTVYGTSLSGGCVATMPGDSREECINTQGKPHEGYDVAIVDAQGNRCLVGEAGEVLIWRPTHGYYKSIDLNREAYSGEDYAHKWEGYEHTGDLGVFDNKGNLAIVGRKKNMILRGGANIFPKEIEDILCQHPKVREIVIVGMPDPVLGERACAYIVPASEKEPPTLGDLTFFLCERKVSKSKWPERVEVIKEMPISPGGKIKREALKDDITKKLQGK